MCPQGNRPEVPYAVIFAVFPINHVFVLWLFREVPALKAITDGRAPVAAGYTG